MHEMSRQKNITQAEYVNAFTVLHGLQVASVYHTQDTMLNLELVDREDRNQKFTLIIDGAWEIHKEGIAVINSELRDGEDAHDYYERLKSIANELKEDVSTLLRITFSDDAQKAKILFDHQLNIEIKSNKFGLISFKNNQTQEYTIAELKGAKVRFTQVSP